MFHENYQDRITQLQQQINGQVAELDVQLEGILERHEKDFLTAYRFHMLKVQKELVSLKQQANESELKAAQEQKLTALEQQIRDLRAECIRIRVECDKQDKVVVELEAKRKELEDDRRFLDFEIRDCRQQNQSLKVAISKIHNKVDELNQEKEELTGKIQKEFSQFGDAAGQSQYSAGVGIDSGNYQV